MMRRQLSAPSNRIVTLTNASEKGPQMTPDEGTQIIDKAKEMGAAMAGIANVELLRSRLPMQL